MSKRAIVIITVAFFICLICSLLDEPTPQDLAKAHRNAVIRNSTP
jgi:hypothetical protein